MFFGLFSGLLQWQASGSRGRFGTGTLWALGVWAVGRTLAEIDLATTSGMPGTFVPEDTQGSPDTVCAAVAGPCRNPLSQSTNTA